MNSPPEDSDQGWAKPAPFGAPAAVQSLSGVAAPLLAGFCVTVTALIIQAPDELRFPDAALMMLSIAVVLLLSCVQCGFWARQYFASPDEASSWFEDFASDPERQKRVHEEQRSYYAIYLEWSLRARITYTIGITAVYAALAVTMIPPGSLVESWPRFVAFAVLAAAAITEVGWTVRGWRIHASGDRPA